MQWYERFPAHALIIHAKKLIRGIKNLCLQFDLKNVRYIWCPNNKHMFWMVLAQKLIPRSQWFYQIYRNNLFRFLAMEYTPKECRIHLTYRCLFFFYA